MAAPPIAAPAAPECRNCSAPLQVLRLAGHYGRQVEIDLCGPCHLVWFDGVEQARLSGPGLLELIGAMAAAQSLAHRGLRPGLACLHCAQPARAVHNRTRWGRSQQLECPQRHGAWQTFGQFLAERGLLRPMSSADRARARARGGALHCVSCGGALGPSDLHCPWCSAVPALVDVARLAQALDPEGATRAHAVHAATAAATALSCAACGATQPADAGWQCVQCGATLTAPRLADAHRQVLALGPALRAHADRPAPEIVRRRLESQDAGLQRQRAFAAQVQAEADARMQGAWTPREDLVPLDLPPNWHRALPWLAAAALLLWWW